MQSSQCACDHCFLERPLDEPPPPATGNRPEVTVPRLTGPVDPALVRYCLKVGLCTVLGDLIGLLSQREDLFIILVTILITARPTYGATLQKMYLRITGAIMRGAATLLVIIIVSLNFETLPTYMLTAVAMFFPFAHSSLGNARMSYAGKQMGVIFSLVFVGLSPYVQYLRASLAHLGCPAW